MKLNNQKDKKHMNRKNDAKLQENVLDTLYYYCSNNERKNIKSEIKNLFHLYQENGDSLEWLKEQIADVANYYLPAFIFADAMNDLDKIFEDKN